MPCKFTAFAGISNQGRSDLFGTFGLRKGYDAVRMAATQNSNILAMNTIVTLKKNLLWRQDNFEGRPLGLPSGSSKNHLMAYLRGNQGMNALVLRMYSAYWGFWVLRLFSRSATPETLMMRPVISSVPKKAQ